MAETLLDIRNLSVPLPPGAERPFAVEGLTLSVAKGEILCIVGETGSGKSLTAMAAMGLLPTALPPPAGSITFEGAEMIGMPEAARRRITGRRMAMIFQEPIAVLNPVYRVGKQVAEVFKLHTTLGKAEINDRVIRLFEEVRLPNPAEIIRSYPHQLSGGQCQRVMIASALALDPALLIADEPTTALDVTTQAQILKLMLDLRDTHGTGVLFITHDFGVVAEIADRVAVMRHGKLVEMGTAHEVLNRPQADYTKQLLAAVPKLVPRAARPSTRPAEEAPALEARQIARTFEGGGMFGRGRTVKAVDNVDVTIRRGETLGLVGESGSGKSTLAQCVIRLEEPDRGDVTISGGAFTGLKGADLRAARRRVQIVFQDPYTALDPRQAVGAAIAEGPIIHGLAPQAARARALELIAAVGLDPSAADRFPHEFSGGQRQRICIARALAVEPELLIADESVSALDVSVQAQVLDLLADMQQRLGFGMLFITHDLRVASRICDRIAVMRGGKIVEIGEPVTLFSNPQQDYTRALLAAVPGRDWQNPTPQESTPTGE